jgi:hypothetical protein
MTGPWGQRKVLEVAFGLIPATLLLPFLLAGVLGTALAVVASGVIDQSSVALIGCVVAGVIGVGALWAVVLSDGALRYDRVNRFVIAGGLLLGIIAAARWLWVMGSSGHRYGSVTWIVWLLLLSGPLIVASFRLVELWSSFRGRITAY